VLINSGSGNSGIEDNAENALSGAFYGIFTTGDGRPGGDFEALIATFHNVIKPFVPSKDGYVPPSLATDPPAGSANTDKTGSSAKGHKTGALTHVSHTHAAAHSGHSAKGAVRQSAARSTHHIDQALERLVHDAVVRPRRR